MRLHEACFLPFNPLVSFPNPAFFSQILAGSMRCQKPALFAAKFQTIFPVFSLDFRDV
jgi:hypothetical protein